MHRTLIAVLLAGSLLFPSSLSAETPPAENTDDVRGMIAAIAEYIERVFLPQDAAPLTEAATRLIVEDGVTFLANAQEESGHFRYEYRPFDGTYSVDDNMVRQAGTLYSLGEVVRRRAAADPALDAAAESAIGYFEDISKEATWNGRTFRCVPNSETSTECKLGSTALALAGILGYTQAHPEKTDAYSELIESYAAYLLAMKKDDEGFRNRYRFGRDAQTEAESPFFNGEALMALVRYDEQFPSEEAGEVIDETFAYLKAQEFETPLYLWIMAALKDLHAQEPKEEYVAYARAFTDWRVAGVSFYRNTDRNYCAYLEGVVSAYSILEDELSEAERRALRGELEYWLVRNARLQLDRDRPYRVVEENGALALKKLADPARAHGGFLTAHDELAQRIDFTQHCITAYVQDLVDLRGAELR